MAEPTTDHLPLSGLKVLDLTQYLAGPYCALLLGDMGADVVKIERTQTGDDSRRIGSVFINGFPALFVGLMRNKRSLSLDLKSEAGRDLFLRLADEADIIVENFRPGTMERLGLGYDDLKPTNPRLIYAKVSGYGSDGPSSHKRGFDLILQAEAGLLSITGEEDGPPASLPLHLVDAGTGMYTALGVLAALNARHESGVGQKVETSLLNTAVGWALGHVTAYYASGVLPRRNGTADATGAPSQAFKAKDGWLVISAFSDEMWAATCQALSAPHLSNDARYTSNAGRLTHRRELASDIEKVLAEATAAEWLERLAENGVPSGPINTLDQAFEHPQVRHNEMIVDQEHPVAGRVKLPATPIKLSTTPLTIRSPAPSIGEHSREVLTGWIHLSDQEVNQLFEEGVVYEELLPEEQ